MVLFHSYVEFKKKLKNEQTEQKQINRGRQQIGGYQRKKGGESRVKWVKDVNYMVTVETRLLVVSMICIQILNYNVGLLKLIML